MKKIFRMALVCALAGATLLYTGCTKDYSDDINDLKERVSTVESTVSQLQAAINAGSVITNVTANTDGYLVTLSNGQSYQVYNGKAGADGTDGKDGVDGNDGKDGAPGENGKDGKDGKDGSVVTIGENGNWFIDGKDTGVKANATVSEITINEDGYICIDGKATDVKAGSVAVWDATKGTVTFKGINADGSDLVIGVCELESIVFIPQVYMEGIEGAKYNYIEGYYYDPYVLDNETLAEYSAYFTTKDDQGAKAVAVAGYPHFADRLLYEDKDGDITENGKQYSWAYYTVGEIAEAEYHVNPNSFDLSKATFTLEGMDVETMSRAGQTYWTPVLKSIARNEDKNAVVTYQIQLPEYATGGQTDRAYVEDIKPYINPYTGTGYYDNQVAVMRLRGTLKDSGKSVDSDYEAIVPFRNELHHLAFTKVSGYTTKFADDGVVVRAQNYKYPYCESDCSIENNEGELYTDSFQAMEQAPSVNVQYQETLDIAEILDVHYHPGNPNSVHETWEETESTMTLGEFLAEYPQFKATYQLIGYTLGDNNSREDMYGQLDGSVFYPCYVKDDGKTQVRNNSAEGETHGISSVGRKPIVLVTVEDEYGVVLYGYFKIKICRDVVNKADFIIKDLGKYPYVCNWQKGTTWSEASHTVLENQLKMSYATFKQRYVWAAGNGKAASPDGKTYIKNEKGEFVDVTPYESPYFYKDKKPIEGLECNFGTFRYTADAEGTGINDKFEIVISEVQQLENIKNAFGGEITLYTKFGSADDYVFMGLTFSVDEPATCTFIERNQNYWYTVGESEANTVFVNPRVPTNGQEDDQWDATYPGKNQPAFKYYGTTSTITGYGVNLEKEWVYNRVQFKFDDATMTAYNKLFGTKTLPLYYHYEFSQNQSWNHNGDTFVVGKSIYNNDDEQSLFLKQAGKDYGKDDVNLYTSENAIARIRTDSVRVYRDAANPEGIRLTRAGEDSYNVDLIIYEHNMTKDNSVAKKLLNQYTKPYQATGEVSGKLSDFLYADVDLVATYGKCDIPLGKETFHVAFFRPLDIVSTKNDGLKDAQAGASWINLFNLFSIKDWQNRDIFTYTPYAAANASKKTEEVQESFKPTTTNMEGGELNWYVFYGINTITVNIDEVMTDQTGTVAYLKTHGDKVKKTYVEGVNDEAILQVALKEGGKGVYTVSKDSLKPAVDENGNKYYEIDITDPSQFLKYALYYANNNTVSKDFNLYLPISIKYWWGELKADVTVPVKATIGTETK